MPSCLGGKSAAAVAASALAASASACSWDTSSAAPMRSQTSTVSSIDPGGMGEGLPSRIAEFRNMPQPLVLVCRSGNRSGIAAAMLHAQGIEAWNGGAWDDIVAVRQHLSAQKV